MSDEQKDAKATKFRKILRLKIGPQRNQELSLLQSRLRDNGYSISKELLYFVWCKISEDTWAMGWNPITPDVAEACWEFVVTEFQIEV